MLSKRQRLVLLAQITTFLATSASSIIESLVQPRFRFCKASKSQVKLMLLALFFPKLKIQTKLNPAHSLPNRRLSARRHKRL
jgi:hypothetical protein